MKRRESNKQLVERFYERFYHKKDFASASELLCDDVVNRHNGMEIDTTNSATK
jgi:predicted SnoaL-like aldol condensation-catalyzing enzyme